MPTNLTLQLFVRGIHGNFLSGIHLHFGTCLKVSFWYPGTYKHKIVRLSSAQFGLVMLYFFPIPVNEKETLDLSFCRAKSGTTKTRRMRPSDKSC